MTTRTITVPVQDVQLGDTIVGVYLPHSRTVTVEREEPDPIPFGTVVKVRWSGTMGVKTAEYGWIVPEAKDRFSHWDDEMVRRMLDNGTIVLLFDPSKEA